MELNLCKLVMAVTCQKSVTGLSRDCSSFLSRVVLFDNTVDGGTFVRALLVGGGNRTGDIKLSGCHGCLTDGIDF